MSGNIPSSSHRHDTSSSQGDDKGEKDGSTQRGNGSGSTSQAASESAGAEGVSFECNICLDIAQDPVVTLCGHLFCWPCLYKWLKLPNHPRECPVCKSEVEEAKVVPLYGRGDTKREDPRKKRIPDNEIPNRPQGQGRRAPPRQHDAFQGFFGPQFGGPFVSTQIGNVNIGFGLIPGLFPALLQVHNIITGYVQPRNTVPEQERNQQEQQLSRILLLIGSFIILCLIFF